MLLEDLRRHSDTISLEAVSGEASKTQALTRLGNYIKEVTNTFLMSTFAPLKDLFAKRDVAAEGRAMSSIPYNEVRGIKATGIAGQQVDFLTIAEHLERGALAMTTLERDVLGPFASWVSNKLSNPSSLASLTSTFVMPGYKPHDIEALDKEFRTFLESDTAQRFTEIPYGMAFKRNADWAPLADKMGALEQALVDDGGHKRIEQMVDNVNANLEKLIARIDEDQQEYKVSGPVLKALSDTAYTVAAELQFYSMLTHRVVMLSEAVAATQKQCAEFRSKRAAK